MRRSIRFADNLIFFLEVDMSTIEIVLVGVSLAMDAFAVSMCKGLSMPKINYKHALIIALFFGVFQAVMPLIGWLLGSAFEKYITTFDHWIAFALLLILGTKALVDAIKDKDDDKNEEYKLDFKELTVLAIATSIDALAVGVTFAFLQVSLALSVSLIGVITFVLCLIGVMIGNKFGSKWKKPASIAGGVVLILMGVKILLEHLGVIAW